MYADPISNLVAKLLLIYIQGFPLADCALLPSTVTSAPDSVQVAAGSSIDWRAGHPEPSGMQSESTDAMAIALFLSTEDSIVAHQQIVLTPNLQPTNSTIAPLSSPFVRDSRDVHDNTIENTDKTLESANSQAPNNQTAIEHPNI